MSASLENLLSLLKDLGIGTVFLDEVLRYYPDEIGFLTRLDFALNSLLLGITDVLFDELQLLFSLDQLSFFVERLLARQDISSLHQLGEEFHLEGQIRCLEWC